MAAGRWSAGELPAPGDPAPGGLVIPTYSDRAHLANSTDGGGGARFGRGGQGKTGLERMGQ